MFSFKKCEVKKKKFIALIFIYLFDNHNPFCFPITFLELNITFNFIVNNMPSLGLNLILKVF